MTKVGLVVRALNEEAHIARLLAGAFKQTRPPDEVILVDSGSTDATIDIALGFPNVHVVRIASAEFSFGRALNRGMAASTADIVVIASAHVYPLQTSWLEELTRPFADDDVVLVYGRQIGDHRTMFSEHQVFRKWFPDHSDLDQGHPFCNNANAAIRRSWWTEQPYDEQLTGLEDLDWASKALKARKRLVYLAPAAVAHVHEQSFRDILNRYRREAIALKKISPDHRLGLVEALVLGLGNISADVVRAIRYRKVPEIPGIVQFRAGQFLGGYIGHRQRGEVSANLKRRFYYPKRFWRAEVVGELPGEPIDYAAHE